MTPIEKNIIVVDENGNEYEATYPKRAKGLVKHGRARFINENTICLACPPENETEDNKMSENIVVNEEIGEVVETKVESVELTVEYCIKQIREIQKQTEYLNDVILKLGDTYAAGPEDIVGQARAQALCDVVKCRETTNQRLIAFYEKMYDNLCSTTPESKSIELIKLSVASELELIKSSNIPGPNKFVMQEEAIKEGRTRMYDVNPAASMTKEDVSAKMVDIIADPNADAASKGHAQAILQSFMEWN
ncbi:MAG: hypothetical protein IJB57_01035 [Clostridia bacterium]|nr:hypothetical protein [Clostridia bacterium]